MYRLPFPVPELSYDDALGVLRSTLRLGISPMLESVEDMLAELGNPDLSFRSLQVAGTNGKTSTSATRRRSCAGRVSGWASTPRPSS